MHSIHNPENYERVGIDDIPGEHLRAVIEALLRHYDLHVYRHEPFDGEPEYLVETEAWKTVVKKH